MSARPPNAPTGRPAADDLAQGREVGPNAVAALNAPAADPETGHHLIEDQQRAVGLRQLAQAGEEAWLRQHQAHVADDRLDDHRGDLAGVGRERGRDGGQIVEFDDDRVGGDGGGDPRRIRARRWSGRRCRPRSGTRRRARDSSRRT